tara:strand:- start:5865 stop:6287 length:423 start_codon:yes stop_codon:yes gene_type:complete
MDKIDVINKYRLSIDKLRIESIWDDIYSVNRVVRYERSVGDIVDMICMNIVKVMELENQFRTIKYSLDKIQIENKNIRLSGIEGLKKSNNLGNYIKTLDRDERLLMTRLDLGVNEVIGDIQLDEFKNKQNIHAKSYSMTS